MASETIQSRKPPGPFSFSFFLLLGFLMLSLFWLFTKYVHLREGDYTDEEAARSLERIAIRDKVLKEADAALNRYAWRDKEKGLVQLPIERGMELALIRLNENRQIRATTLVDPIAAAKELEATQSASPAPTPGSTASPGLNQAPSAQPASAPSSSN
jgi:hypothetical protein